MPVMRPSISGLRWARCESDVVDPCILQLERPKVPEKEPAVFRIRQVRDILDVCGLSQIGLDGMSDVMLDSMARGRVELRVRWCTFQSRRA
jgi:hypothetical protein